MYIQKTIISTPYYIPLSVHKLTAYTYNLQNQVVTAVVFSYFNEEAMGQPDSQPLAQYSVVMEAPSSPPDDIVEWIGQQLVDGGDSVSNEYSYQGSYQLIGRNTFQGGTVISS